MHTAHTLFRLSTVGIFVTRGKSSLVRSRPQLEGQEMCVCTPLCVFFCTVIHVYAFTVCVLPTQLFRTQAQIPADLPAWVEGELGLESRLWRRLQWLTTQQSTHPPCPPKAPQTSPPSPWTLPLARLLSSSIFSPRTHTHTCWKWLEKRDSVSVGWAVCGPNLSERLLCVSVCVSVHVCPEVVLYVCMLSFTHTQSIHYLSQMSHSQQEWVSNTFNDPTLHD